VVHVASLVLGTQDSNGLRLSDSARVPRVVVCDEAGKRLADDEADVKWQTRFVTLGTARAVKNHDVVGMAEDDVARDRVRDDLLDPAQFEIGVEHHKPLGCLERNDFAVVAVGERVAT